MLSLADRMSGPCTGNSKSGLGCSFTVGEGDSLLIDLLFDEVEMDEGEGEEELEVSTRGQSFPWTKGDEFELEVLKVASSGAPKIFSLRNLEVVFDFSGVVVVFEFAKYFDSVEVSIDCCCNGIRV